MRDAKYIACLPADLAASATSSIGIGHLANFKRLT
jgi:hypothetical protein